MRQNGCIAFGNNVLTFEGFFFFIYSSGAVLLQLLEERLSLRKVEVELLENPGVSTWRTSWCEVTTRDRRVDVLQSCELVEDEVTVKLDSFIETSAGMRFTFGWVSLSRNVHLRKLSRGWVHLLKA